jgi:benzoate membrane transport protein
MNESGRSSAWTPILAGVVTAVVGFASSFAVVLAGLARMGATPPRRRPG